MHLLVNTGGGDAPGLNAVIRAVVIAALHRNWKVTGIRFGYEGLLESDGEGLIAMDRAKVRGIAHVGGTILGTRNTGHPFNYPVKKPDGTIVYEDISDKVVQRFKEVKGDAVIVIGGDGSLTLAQKFFEKGVPIVGVPKTIDNDLGCTAYTFGFDTAVMVATDALDRLHTTAESHQRVMVVEVMGRHSGWIALNAGVAGSADVILIPEIEYDMEKVCEKIMQRERSGSHFAIVVVAEGAKPKHGEITTVGKNDTGEVRFGGVAEKVAMEIAKRTGKETRHIVLGHLQRGGGPTAFDRLIGTRFGAAAVRAVEQKEFGKMVALDPPNIKYVPIIDAIRHRKNVSIDSDTVLTARDLGVSFGD